MSNLARRADVVVVGAGLAGLATTRQLVADGVDVALLESADAPGGRVRTDRQDGIQRDRGFQLFNPAYSEARRVFDLASLDLRSFGARDDPRPGRLVTAEAGAAPLGARGRLRPCRPDQDLAGLVARR